MKVVWAMLCENFVQDKNTNLLSLFNVIEEIRFLAAAPTSEPGETAQIIAHPFKLVASIVRSDPAVQERGSTRVTMTSPDGLMDTSAEMEVNLADFETYRVWFNYSGLPVSSGGIHKFLVHCKSEGGEWREPFEVPLRVKLGPPLDM